MQPSHNRVQPSAIACRPVHHLPDPPHPTLKVLKDSKDGGIWLMVHSGSRRIGNETATHYDRLAKKQMAQLGRQVYGQLHYLDADSDVGKQYLQDMSWCQVTGIVCASRVTGR